MFPRANAPMFCRRHPCFPWSFHFKLQSLKIYNCAGKGFWVPSQQLSVRQNRGWPRAHPHHKSLHAQQHLLQEVITCGMFSVALEAAQRLVIIPETYQKQEFIVELLYGMIFSINNFNNLTGTKINLPFSSASITKE